jgi:hypothetical protein
MVAGSRPYAFGRYDPRDTIGSGHVDEDTASELEKPETLEYLIC